MQNRLITMTDHELLEQSFEIAWNVLELSGELGNRDDAARYLLDKLGEMIGRGERRRLLLTNAAIDAYRDRYQPLTLVAC